MVISLRKIFHVELSELQESIIFTCSEYSRFFPHRTDSEDWKEFISKPSLPYALRLLTGLSGGHTGIQQQIGKDIIPVLHKLEQVSSDEHIGTMAENLMEALKENQQVKARVSVKVQCDTGRIRIIKYI